MVSRTGYDLSAETCLSTDLAVGQRMSHQVLNRFPSPGEHLSANKTKDNDEQLLTRPKMAQAKTLLAVRPKLEDHSRVGASLGGVFRAIGRH